MEFDFKNFNPKDRYKLLSSTVIPRPIALVSTVDEDGTLNAAPFSFFNVFAEDPATCVIGISRRSDGSYNDTSRIIREGGEFVVNMVDMDLAEGMNYNPYFAGNQIAMPQPLFEEMVEYGDGTAAAIEQMAADVTTFLAWTSEPSLEPRHRLGLQVSIFLVLLTVLFYFVKRRVWADVH